ncbi:MAG: hypothetical protein ACJ8AW_11495 [Rhodopila sp.]
MPNPEAERPITDPRLGLRFVAAAHLIDLFEGAPGDTNFAWEMAHSAIDAYSPQTRADCLNAARTIAFSMAALALLSRIAREPMKLPEQLQAFDRANALNSSADRSERTMMLRRRTQKTRPSPTPTASQPAPDVPAPPAQPDPDWQATPAEEAEIKAIVAEAMKDYHAATAGKQAASPGTAAADQPFETRLEATLRTCMSGFEPPVPGTTGLKQTLLRNTAVPAMPAQAPARHPA